MSPQITRRHQRNISARFRNSPPDSCPALARLQIIRAGNPGVITEQSASTARLPIDASEN